MEYSDLQVEASLQLSAYSYVTRMNGLADEQDTRLRFALGMTPPAHKLYALADFRTRASVSA